VVCIGSPHQGSPHAKAADLLYGIFRNLDAAAPQVLAELLHARSEGIQDLQHGTIVDEAWEDEKADPGFPQAERTIPRVDGVGYSFVAATVTHDPEHPLGHLLGDLIVRLPSAAGDPSESDHRLPFHGGTVLHGLHHFDLTNHPEVYEAVRDQIAAGTAATER
jgi:hypothetical protein